ncbi:MAG: alpha/beta hydrolase [Alphaproteobacteria bacterium]|nr:alpha/beta hydrolase [Alphaproteobacteria bacterium]
MPRIPIAGTPAGFTERQVTLGEVTLNYVEGPDHGRPLLLIPGQMESWQGYKQVLPALAERFHVFVPDVRGHGRSSRTPGAYSYNLCGQDLAAFLQQVIGQPALVSGLSSGGVLSIWLGAYAPEHVLAVISEDPPIFASIWPRIQQERHMAYGFQVAVDTLGGPERDLKGWLSKVGYPPPGETELRHIPGFIVSGLYGWTRLWQRLRPGRPYDIPLFSFNLRMGLMGLSEYDPDFSLATVDGRLSEGFDPEDALRRVRCPMLLLRANARRHETWGLLGAMDDDDVARVEALVADLKVVPVACEHAIHMLEPEAWLAAVTGFVDELEESGRI